MNRPRTALFALLALAAVPGLSACSGSGSSGGPVHTGAAAVVSGQRISVAELESQVTAFRAVAPAHGQPATQTSRAVYGQDSAGMPDHVLQFLIEQQVVQSALAAKGLSPAAGDAVAAENSDLRQAGSRADLENAFVKVLGLPPADLDDWYRTKSGELTLLQAAGVDTNSSQAAVELEKILTTAAAAEGIEINPRYGSAWSPIKPQLVGPVQPWIKEA